MRTYWEGRVKTPLCLEAWGQVILGWISCNFWGSCEHHQKGPESVVGLDLPSLYLLLTNKICSGKKKHNLYKSLLMHVRKGNGICTIMQEHFSYLIRTLFYQRCGLGHHWSLVPVKTEKVRKHSRLNCFVSKLYLFIADVLTFLASYRMKISKYAVDSWGLTKFIKCLFYFLAVMSNK